MTIIQIFNIKTKNKIKINPKYPFTKMIILKKMLIIICKIL